MSFVYTSAGNGTAAAIRNVRWTDEVSGMFRKLVDKPGEDAKPWRAKKGVWKATFDILNGDTSIHREESWFDLRKTSTPGFMLMVF